MASGASAARPRVSWFELFYDLVIVAAVAHGGHIYVEDSSLGLGAWLVVSFVITIVLWLSTSLTVNIDRSPVTGRKSLMFVQMVALVVANLSLSRTSGLQDNWGFAALAVSFATVSAIYALLGRSNVERRSVTRPWMWSMAAAAVILLVGVAVPDGATLLATSVLTCGVLVALVSVGISGLPALCRAGLIDSDHLSERLGQLVLIIVGESFLGLVLVLQGVGGIPSPVFFILSFLVAGSLWIIYFSAVLPLNLPPSSARLELWLASFVIFLLGAVFTAELLAAYAATDWSDLSGWHPWAPLSVTYVLVGALMLALVGGESTDRRFATVHAAALVVLGSLWIAFLWAGSAAGNALVLGGGMLLIADAFACRHLAQRGADAP